MLRTLCLGDTGVETTPLGFGCADLLREPSRVRRRRLLEVALEAGVSHFDVAPMYGLGLLEGELGRFARGRRDRIVIATKFGIAPTSVARALARAQGPIRRLSGGIPALARTAGDDPRSGAVGALLYRASGYSGSAARASLERSLRRLGTDHVDILFLHDPMPGTVQSDDVRGCLESLRAAGRIRAWGVAGEPEPSLEAARRLGSRIPIVQIRGDIFFPSLRSSAAQSAGAMILFGVIGRALTRILAHVQADTSARVRWNDAVGADCGRPDAVAALLLRDALDANPGGTVLFSTRQERRIHAAVAAANQDGGPDPGLEAFRRLVWDDLVASVDAT